MAQRQSFQIGTGLFILLGFAALAYLATQTTSLANYSQGASYSIKARFTGEITFSDVVPLVSYVISGEGTMLLDGEEISLSPGVVVYVPKNVRHKARGDLTVLLVCVPPGVMDDIHELE